MGKMTFCMPGRRRQPTFFGRVGFLWWIIRIFHWVVIAQFGTGITLFFIGLIGLVNYGDSVQWFAASVVFGTLPCLSATSGYYSIKIDSNIRYRLLQIIHLSLNLLLLPGCGYTTVILGQMITSTYKKLSASSWSWEEKADEMSLQGCRIFLLICYCAIMLEQLIGSFLGGFLISVYPNLVPKFARLEETTGRDVGSHLELRGIQRPVSAEPGGGSSVSRSVRSI